MRNLTNIEQVKWAAFLVKLQGALRKPENEKHLLINGELRRVA